MPGARATVKMEELVTNRPFHVIGTGTTRAAAIAELQAKMALTVGFQGDGTISEPMTLVEKGDANVDTQFSNAELTLQNAAGKLVSIFLDNISTAYGTGVNGQINLANADIVTFATNYRDGGGLGGYVPYAGKFVK